MGMFAETAIVDYRLSFADQEIRLPFSFAAKKTEACRFRLPFAANKRKLLISVSSAFRV
jgi:hypothetical protein